MEVRKERKDQKCRCLGTEVPKTQSFVVRMKDREVGRGDDLENKSLRQQGKKGKKRTIKSPYLSRKWSPVLMRVWGLRIVTGVLMLVIQISATHRLVSELVQVIKLFLVNNEIVKLWVSQITTQASGCFLVINFYSIYKSNSFKVLGKYSASDGLKSQPQLSLKVP